ncbi:MAG: glycine cleavage system aminomethyltransferase GcvT [Candidatus Bathyarchaeota archaeon]|nr:glycine cleavage system aminomethyltransferase GcvT [Candidatus Bathyarchaeota archaeon]
MTAQAKKTQLYEIHKKTAKLTMFAGFEMPLLYEGIIAEHLAVRDNVGVFDISHMGRVTISGADAERFVNYVITNDVSKLAPNNAQYSVMCNEKGGIIDDFVVYRLEPETFMIVFNASNRKKDYDWISGNSKNLGVEIKDVSDDVAMFAVQGPKAEKTLQAISTADLGKIERFKCGSSRLADVDVFMARTGYTGEDGFEIFVWDSPLIKPDKAVKLWNAILEAGKAYGILPCGLGARDTLRLEAGLCLYGNDIDENTTPLEAGLGFVAKLQKEDFIGKTALVAQKAEGLKRKRVAVKMAGEGIPRSGFEIYDEKGLKVGQLTSGTFSPLLRCGIGMGYVPTSLAQEGSHVKVKIRDKLADATIVSLPFYDPEKYGFRRKTAP